MASPASCALPTVRVGAGLPALPAQPSARSSTGGSTPAVSLRHVCGSSTLQGRFYRSILPASGPESRKPCRIVAMASSEGERDPAQGVLETVKSIQESWEKVDDKLAIGGLGFAALLVLWASTGLIAAIDKLPIIPGFFELIGILFSGWFVYRYLLFKPDREELLKKIEEAKSKITGQ